MENRKLEIQSYKYQEGYFFAICAISNYNIFSIFIPFTYLANGAAFKLKLMIFCTFYK